MEIGAKGHGASVERGAPHWTDDPCPMALGLHGLSRDDDGYPDINFCSRET